MIIDIVRLVSNKTYKGKDGKEHHYENYTIVARMENGKVVKIPFIPNWKLDSKVGEKLRYVAITMKDNNGTKN